ncbi:MAG: hypothetical protein M3246_02630 [Actinomycetota bacterium]|nr:hypothetical protein [Actinomycetota bacterium]
MGWSRINPGETERTKGTAPRTGGGARNPGREQAREAVAKAEKVAELLEQAFELMAEDDPIQPAVKHLYATLCEAEVRLTVLENWYRRTYGLRGPDSGEPAESK